jgi:hypothetical protein
VSPQELRKRARADEDALELLRQIAREQAVQRGLLDFLVAAQRRGLSDARSGALDSLIEAAHGAMGSKVWTVAELLSRTLEPDREGRDLASAIEATGAESARSLGRFLASRVPYGASRCTDEGLELRRCGHSSEGSLIWLVGRV